MTLIKPFCCIRPSADAAFHVAALPYDVYSRKEAKAETEREPLSFLKIDRAETQFPDEIDTYDACVYKKAGETLNAMIQDGTLITEQTPCYYLYELTMGTHVQTGIVACSSVDDYLNGVIKKHENTREDKEQDRICHVDVTNAHTGPIFLAYRFREELGELVKEVKKEEPIYDFVSPDGIGHRVFRISEGERLTRITEALKETACTYIADGHHRAASAVKVALKRREAQPDYTGDEEFNYFLSVLFPDTELQILPYNRVVKDLNGLSETEFLKAIERNFEVKIEGQAKTDGYMPGKKGTFGMFLGGIWYELSAKPAICSDDPVNGLDVSILQDYLLEPILGIMDPRTDQRIAFIGGIRGLNELERRVSEDMAVAFSMYPTSMDELLRVADAGLLMPPKSTWFEPKLRSGIFIHRLT
ncbi:MAG: DUF1015 family protein [Clostridium sp.]